jgi:LIVCS family branched-chain amino acid:cation transporter
MPASWISFLHLEGMISFLEQYLPFFDSGFGWIAPSILGLIIGCVLYFFQNPMKNINAAYSKE